MRCSQSYFSSLPHTPIPWHLYEITVLYPVYSYEQLYRFPYIAESRLLYMLFRYHFVIKDRGVFSCHIYREIKVTVHVMKVSLCCNKGIENTGAFCYFAMLQKNIIFNDLEWVDKHFRYKFCSRHLCQ